MNWLGFTLCLNAVAHRRQSLSRTASSSTTRLLAVYWPCALGLAASPKGTAFPRPYPLYTSSERLGLFLAGAETGPIRRGSRRYAPPFLTPLQTS
jgi:hypothetical protein